MGVTEISLHFRKGEEDKRRDRVRRRDASEGEIIFPLKASVWTSSFYRDALTHTYVYFTGAFEGTLATIICNNKFVFSIYKLKIRQT